MSHDLSMKNATVDLGNKVALYGEFGAAVVFGTTRDYSSLSQALEDFEKDFRVVNQERILANPNDSYNLDVDFIRLIERLSEGKVFGFLYEEAICGDGQIYANHNGADHGIFFAPDEDFYPRAYVFTPVKQFTVVGYELDQDERDGE